MDTSRLIHKLNNSVRELNTIRETSNGIINSLRNEFQIDNLGSIEPNDLENVLQVCLVGRDIWFLREEDPHWKTPADIQSRMLDFTLDIEAFLRYAIRIDTSVLKPISVADFTIERFLQLIDPNKKVNSAPAEENGIETTANAIENKVFFAFDYGELADRAALFEPSFVNGEFTTRVNSQHAWNRLMEENPLAMNAFYDAVSASLQRLNDNSLKEVRRFLLEVSVFLNMYVDTHIKNNS